MVGLALRKLGSDFQMQTDCLHLDGTQKQVTKHTANDDQFLTLILALTLEYFNYVYKSSFEIAGKIHNNCTKQTDRH
jgi:hypothetical protein